MDSICHLDGYIKIKIAKSAGCIADEAKKIRYQNRNKNVFYVRVYINLVPWLVKISCLSMKISSLSNKN